MPIPVVVVSPHCDDAVLSCFTVLAAGRADCTVVTVFSASDDDESAWWGKETQRPDPESRNSERLDEDRRALARLGCAAVHLGLVERLSREGIDRARPLLAPILADAQEVHAPAGIADKAAHPQHRALRRLTLELRPDAVLYADQPYCGFRSDTVLPAKVAPDRVREVVALDAAARAEKRAAVECYTSQLPALERLFGPFLAHLDHEVRWRLQSPESSDSAKGA